MKKALNIATLTLAVLASPALAETPKEAPAKPVKVTTADKHFAKGVALYKAGDVQKSVRWFRSALRKQPTFKAALYLGSAYLKLDNLGRSKKVFEKSLAMATSDAKRQAVMNLIKKIEERDVAKVTIRSKPLGATVFVDEKPIGKTPLEVSLPSGFRKMRLEYEGHEIEEHKVRLRYGREKKMLVRLAAKPCEIKVDAPKSARVAINGRRTVRASKTIRVRPGKHRLRITQPGYKAKSERIECGPGQKLALNADLTPATGRVNMPLPPGAVVMINGKPVEVDGAPGGEGMDLPPGKHEVLVTAPGRKPFTKVVEVTAGKEFALNLPDPPKPPAYKPPPAPIPEYKRTFYVGVGGSFNMVVNEWDLGSNAFKSQDGMTHFAPGSSAAGGLRVGYTLLESLHVETELQYVGLPNMVDTSKGLAYGLNALYQFEFGRMMPFIQGGAGAYHVLSGALGGNVDMRGHVGLGVRGQISRRFLLRADVRNVFTDGFTKAGNNVEFMTGIEMFWSR